MRTGRSSMSETSKLNGQRTCPLKNMNSRIELMRSAVEDMEFCLLLFCRKVVHFLTDEGAHSFALSFISKSWYDGT
jgi:hypothetical protein